MESKFQRDNRKARETRKMVDDMLNTFFQRNYLPYEVIPVHKEEKDQSGKASNKNTLTNRFTEVNPENTLGYDRILRNTITKVQLLLIIRWSTDPTCYLKSTSTPISNPQEYIDALISEKAHFLYVKVVNGRPINQFSNLLPVADYHHKWVIDETSATNHNRITIPKINPSTIDYNDIDESSGLPGMFTSLLNQIRKLLP